MSVMAFRTKERNKRIALNITPLIDVLFLLLIFFMVTGTFKRAGELELHLPESSTSTPSTKEAEFEQVELVLTEVGMLIIDGQGCTLPEAKSRLLAIIAEKPESRVMIKAESGVEHGEVVRILDIVREAGYPGVGLGTRLSLQSED